MIIVVNIKQDTLHRFADHFARSALCGNGLLSVFLRGHTLLLTEGAIECNLAAEAAVGGNEVEAEFAEQNGTCGQIDSGTADRLGEIQTCGDAKLSIQRRYADTEAFRNVLGV